MDNTQLAHFFYFELTDKSDELAERFIRLCWDYLGGHPGQLHFSIGRRALGHERFNRSVSAIDFDVSVHMIFEDLAAYDAYRHDPRHDAFITEVAGMSTGREVYDSFLTEMPTPRTKNGGRSAKKK